MNKIAKTLLAVLGVTLVSGVIVKERNTLNDLRKRLFEVRWCGTDKPRKN
jgi:hypothetical protein